jgi:hypothetical protein
MKDNGPDASLVTADGIRRLISFLPLLSDRNAKHGDGPSIEDAGENAFSILPAVLSETSSSFVEACYDENFVQPFDWTEWSKRHETELSDQTFIAQADIPRIIRLLTTHIRADRFCDGHLLSVLEDGTVVRILERLNEINSEQSPPAYPEGRADAPSGSAEA